MKKLYKIVFSFINTCLVALMVITLVNTDLQSKNIIVNNQNNQKLVNSNQLTKETVTVTIKEHKEEQKKVVVVKQENQNTPQAKNETIKSDKKQTESKKVEEKKETKIEQKKETPVIKEEITKYNVLETFTGTLSAYGTDCSGCSTRTSSGFDISKSIYYNDKKYGNVRILAGDRKYPYGTIVNLKLSDKTEMKGIVLDRGGDIGIGKKFQFDILLNSQKEAYKFGTKKNTTFEILRLGY